jgi:exodeoxyribonuclease VII large subunit
MSEANAVIPVGELNKRARQILEREFPLQWVDGEISNLTRATSGHLYFSLKDELAQVRCVMFRSRAQALALANRQWTASGGTRAGFAV